jgi:hypothetical protein
VGRDFLPARAERRPKEGKEDVQGERNVADERNKERQREARRSSTKLANTNTGGGKTARKTSSGSKIADMLDVTNEEGGHVRQRQALSLVSSVRLGE